MNTPHTLYHLNRQPNLMTDEERAELFDEGWQPEIINELADRGFRPCKPDIVSARFESAIGQSCGFLRQTSTPHLHITVERDEFIEVVRERIDTAIYEAGWSAGADHLASYFRRFQEAVQRPRSARETELSIEKRLAALEKTLAETPRKIRTFYDGKDWRGAKCCTCGFTASTGDRPKDEAALAAHTCL